MLRGHIAVNDTTIVTWTARRLVSPPQERNDYEVGVSYVDPVGEVHSARGVVSHRYDDGPLVLASEVMAWAHGQVHDLAVP